MDELLQRKKDEKLEKELENDLRKRRNFYFNQTEKEEKEHERKSREKLKSVIENYLKSEEDIKKEREAMEKVEEQKRRICRNVAETLEKKRKKKEKVIDSKRKIKNLEVFERLTQELEEKTKQENEKIHAENVEKDEKKRKEFLLLIRKREELRKERIADRKRFEEEMKKKKAEEKLMREREVSERMQRMHCDKIWNEGEKRKDNEKKLTIRMALKQQREADAERRKEDEKWEKLYLGNLDKENEDVITYCDYVLDAAKTYSRPLFPILSAVKNVKVEYGIIQPKRNINHLKSKIPIQGWQPTSGC